MKLEKRDIIIKRNWFRSMKSIINWNDESLELDNMQVEELLEWLKDLKEIFEDFPEETLSLERSSMDHAINLIQDQISSSSLIFEKTQDHQFIRETLDEMTRKNWIWSSSSFIEALLFLVSKSEKKKLIIDYRNLLNSVMMKDLNILSLIKDILD